MRPENLLFQWGSFIRITVVVRVSTRLTSRASMGKQHLAGGCPPIDQVGPAGEFPITGSCFDFPTLAGQKSSNIHSAERVYIYICIYM